MQKLVTVVMAVYNGEKFIKESIDCILNQTYANFDLLIINDGSTDETENIIKSYNDDRIIYSVNEKNLGLNGTRIKGLNLIKTKYTAIFDSDDLCLPNKLEVQIDYLENNPDVALCGTWGLMINEKSEVFGHEIMPTSDKNLVNIEMLFRNQFINPSVIYVTEVAKQVGGYDKDNFCEDYCLYSKISMQYKMANIPEFLTFYRIHDFNMTKTEKKDTIKFSEHQILENLYHKFNIESKYLNIPKAFIENDFSKIEASLVGVFFKKLIETNSTEKLYEVNFFNQVLFSYWYKIIIETQKKESIISFFKFSKKYKNALTSKQKRKLIKILLNPFK